MPRMPALLGTYAPPTVKVGDRIRCLYRNRLCVVSGWTAGPLAWPTGHPIKGSGRGGILITAALVRAVRTEPYEALMGALGVSQGTVFNWRRRFGSPPPRPRPPRPKPPGFQEEQTRRAVELGVKPQRRWQRNGWTPEQLALLGTALDAEVAARLGRSAGEVLRKQWLRRVPAFPMGPESGGRAWA